MGSVQIKSGFLCLLILAGSMLSASALQRAPAIFSAISKAIGSGYTVIDAVKNDLDGDGTPEVIAITRKSLKDGHPMDGEIVVLQLQGNHFKAVWRQKKLNPWKLQIGDVDKDSKREIIAGVWKKSPKDPVMAKRTFVYSWNGKRMLPKWLGSRLSRRFDDFAVCDINHDGMAELVSLEIMPKRQHRVAAYRWLSFGFEWLGCSEIKKELISVNPERGGIVVRSRGGKLWVVLAGDKVQLKK